jgi:hypothetical protein
LSVASWDYPIPFQISDVLGTLNINAPLTVASGTGLLLLNPQACNTQIALRPPDTNLPQKDGAQLHRRFFGSYQMTLALQFWEGGDSPACDELLQDMVDEVMKHIRALANPPLWITGPVIAQDPRILWTPSGANQRMLKNVRLSGDIEATITIEQTGITQVAFIVRSGYPYAMDAAETTTALDATLTNGGSAEFWPVIQVSGPTSGFTITNQSILDDDGNMLAIVYDASQPGASSIAGGNYVEIDLFAETMYLNGSGANMKPGLVMDDSTFFPIGVGANDLTIIGATANVLWQNAWA